MKVLGVGVVVGLVGLSFDGSVGLLLGFAVGVLVGFRLVGRGVPETGEGAMASDLIGAPEAEGRATAEVPHWDDVQTDYYPDFAPGALVLASLVSALAKAVRRDYAETGSGLRASLHPGILVLSAFISFVSSCVWAWYSLSFASFVLFLLSVVLAAAAALSLELRRGRPAVGIVAALGIGVLWFLLGGFIYLSILFSAHPGF